MKQPYTILTAFLLLTMFSCKKSTVAEKVTASLTGKWSVINDASSLAGTPIFAGGSSNYIGTVSDYFIFTATDSLYIKEGNGLDTATYKIVNANTVNVLFFVADGVGFYPNGATRGNYTITNLTEHTVTLTLPTAITPEGSENEVINLKR